MDAVCTDTDRDEMIFHYHLAVCFTDLFHLPVLKLRLRLASGFNMFCLNVIRYYVHMYM